MSADGFPLILISVSFVTGIVGSILGLGGGFIIVPVLTLFLGVPIQLAIGASLIAVIASSSNSAARLLKHGAANLRIATFLESATTAGAFTGVLIAGWIEPRALYFLFGGVLLYSAYSMYQLRTKDHRTQKPTPASTALATRLDLHGSYYDPQLRTTVEYEVKKPLLGMALMYLAGIVSALLGIGSGVLKIPAMDRVMDLPIKVSSATSNLMVGVTSTASALAYFWMGRIQPQIAAPVALGILGGSFIGARLLLHLRGEWIRKIFIVLLVVLGAQMLWRGFA